MGAGGGGAGARQSGLTNRRHSVFNIDRGISVWGVSIYNIIICAFIQTMDSPELAAVVSYWSRILRCPWRANGNAFYTRALKFLKLGHEPNLERGAKRRFLRWMDEGFEWSEKHSSIVLTTDTPFPNQINLPRISRTFIVVPGKKEAAVIVEKAYKVNQVGMSGGERLFDTLRSQYLNLTRSDVYATLKRFKSRLLGRAPEANPTIRPRIMERVFEECQIDIIDFGGSSKKTPVSGKPLPSDLTRANDGYRYILTGSCSFSKFMFCCEPLKTKSTAVYAAVLTEIFSLLGPPETLLADREFDCAEIHLMCLRLGIEPKFTKSYDKARTGSIERLNSTVRTSLQNYMSQNDTDVWFRHTQELMLSYNRKKHSSTKAGPFEVMFRRHSAQTIDDRLPEAQ